MTASNHIKYLYSICIWPNNGISYSYSGKGKKGKGFPYSLPSVGPGTDPGVQTVSPQVTISHPSGDRLPLLSVRPAVTFPATEHHRPLAGTKLYCLVTEAHMCEQLAQCCCAALPWVGFQPTSCWLQVQRSTRWATTPPILIQPSSNFPVGTALP